MPGTMDQAGRPQRLTLVWVEAAGPVLWPWMGQATPASAITMTLTMT